jgi:hypothetical protein
MSLFGKKCNKFRTAEKWRVDGAAFRSSEFGEGHKTSRSLELSPEGKSS